jgi:peptidoglycan hydrolase CwlO-like protein
MDADIILSVLGSNVIVGILSYFTGRRKMNVEIDNQILTNLEKSVNVYRGIIEDLKHQIESLNIKVQELEDKVDELMEENHNLKRKHIL